MDEGRGRKREPSEYASEPSNLTEGPGARRPSVPRNVFIESFGKISPLFEYLSAFRMIWRSCGVSFWWSSMKVIRQRSLKAAPLCHLMGSKAIIPLK